MGEGVALGIKWREGERCTGKGRLFFFSFPSVFSCLTLSHYQKSGLGGQSVSSLWNCPMRIFVLGTNSRVPSVGDSPAEFSGDWGKHRGFPLPGLCRAPLCVPLLLAPCPLGGSWCVPGVAEGRSRGERRAGSAVRGAAGALPHICPAGTGGHIWDGGKRRRGDWQRLPTP